MKGQMSIFDIDTGEKKKWGPSSYYRFKRYIGQRVKFWRDGETGTITEIEPYYTIVKPDNGGGDMAGTPTTICPIEEAEYET